MKVTRDEDYLNVEFDNKPGSLKISWTPPQIQDEELLDMENHNYEDYKQEETDNMPELMKDELSLQDQEDEIDERVTKLHTEPRDWRKAIDNPCIDYGDIVYCLEHATISCRLDAIILTGYAISLEMDVEIFKSREKIDSFIEALILARDEVFPE